MARGVSPLHRLFWRLSACSREVRAAVRSRIRLFDACVVAEANALTRSSPISPETR